MAIATARAKAQRAREEAKKEKAEGEARVMKAKYKEEEVKTRAIVVAKREKEVAELSASKKVEVARLAKEEAEVRAAQQVAVAKLDKDAAAFTKQKNILLGEGEAARKKLVLEADGALAQKLATYTQVHNAWATAYATRKVPSLIMGGGGGGAGVKAGTDQDTVNFSQAMQLLVAKQLGLDLGIRGAGGK